MSARRCSVTSFACAAEIKAQKSAILDRLILFLFTPFLENSREGEWVK